MQKMISINKSLCTAIIIIVFCLIPASAAQTDDRISFEANAYQFLNLQHNVIRNDAKEMAAFYKKLHQLKTHGKGKVSILHIGDSHIQADLMTCIIREGLQTEFGNAGRGLIFPYAQARTNSPSDVITRSNAYWLSRRSASPAVDMPTGISGFTIASEKQEASIDISFPEEKMMRNAFTRLTLFYGIESGNYTFLLWDTCGRIHHAEYSSGKDIPYTVTFSLPFPMTSVRLEAVPIYAGYSCVMIYGIMLENKTAGILYHNAGVNGATFKSFNESALFVPHAQILDPDLVIISLGSNDSVEKTLNSQELYMQIDRLVLAMRRENPKLPILFTTPPDFGNQHNDYLQQNIKMTRETIIRYCRAQKLAFWDLYNVMGDYRAVDRWRKYNLVQKDLMHFSRKGYQIQGDLLLRALMKGYYDYEKH